MISRAARLNQIRATGLAMRHVPFAALFIFFNLFFYYFMTKWEMRVGRPSFIFLYATQWLDTNVTITASLIVIFQITLTNDGLYKKDPEEEAWKLF